MNVLFTVDTEIWCPSWQRLDADFPAAFDRFIGGRTAQGDYGLAFKRHVLDAHGLAGVFFVEPLFSLRFGPAPLAEVVGTLSGGRHETQLHLHTEWLDEAPNPPLTCHGEKRQHMRHFSLDEQRTLLMTGVQLLQQAGSEAVQAFRAGGFGFNVDTLRALASLGIPFDSSYNGSLLGPCSGLVPGGVLVAPRAFHGVTEVPLTVFRDGTRGLRHAQLTACSFKELQGLLWRALEEGRSHFVILSHSAELLVRGQSRLDRVALDRFTGLCKFLERHSDSFRTIGFRDIAPLVHDVQPQRPHAPLHSPLWRTGGRMLEQAYRRHYRIRPG
jgi:hypothetical protein